MFTQPTSRWSRKCSRLAVASSSQAISSSSLASSGSPYVCNRTRPYGRPDRAKATARPGVIRFVVAGPNPGSAPPGTARVDRRGEVALAVLGILQRGFHEERDTGRGREESALVGHREPFRESPGTYLQQRLELFDREIWKQRLNCWISLRCARVTCVRV